jgi:Tfp pilus assembly protein PilF
LAKRAVARALQLDSTLADAHTTLALIHFGFDRDWRKAETEFRKAIVLAPSSPQPQQQYSRFLLAMGRNDEAREAGQRAVELSPAAPLMVEQLGWQYLHARQYDRGREALWRSLEMDSTAWRTHFDLALLEQAAGNFPEAEARLRVPLQVAPERAEVQLALGQLYAATGRVDQAKEILQQLRQTAEQRYVSPYFIACLQASLGLRSQAFAFLDRAVRERSEFVAYLRIDPRVDSLRADRRFARLLRHLRLP